MLPVVKSRLDRGTVSCTRKSSAHGIRRPLFCSRCQCLFSVGGMSENDSLKPRDMEVAGHSTNAYQLARSVDVQ